jgi:hypothetical protein
MKRALAVAVLLLIGAAAPADAQSSRRTLTPSAFDGTWSGKGVASNDDSLYFGVTARDLDVVIRAAGDGFSVQWTSVIRQGGDPRNPDVRRKSTTRTFVPGAAPNVFRAKEEGDPYRDGELCWARLDGTSLTVYQMVVGADGRYELQRYRRTLSGAGMQLSYTRLRDGEQVRTVRGQLVKVAK